MEGSKSDEDNSTTQETKKLAENQTGVTIVDTEIEKEIQNILIAGEYDQNQPSCSWKESGQQPTGTEKKEGRPFKTESTSSLSVSIDVHSPTFRKPQTNVQKNIQPKEPSNPQEIPKDQDNEQSSSLNTLFDGLEVLGQVTITLPEAPMINQPQIQSPVVTSQPRTQNPPIRNQPQPKQPRVQPAVHSRNPEVPTNTSRGIHVVNIPSDSMNRTLPRVRPRNEQDPVLGPPPSYSKSLLDRRINPCASIQFVAPIPPPSYDGMENELRYAHTLGHTGGFTLGLGNTWQGQPQPAYCPVCETVIITQVDIRVSRIAHIVAMVMFLLLCWPFCLLPYFLNICNYTFHYCSVCHSYLGARRPFQRG